MSVVYTFPKSSRRSVEEKIAFFRQKIVFEQEDKNAKGYYFDYGEDGKIGYAITESNPKIYPLVYSQVANEDGSFSLSIRGPLMIMNKIKNDSVREEFEKRGETFTPEIKKLTPMSPNLEFNGDLRDYQEIDCPKIIDQMENTGGCLFIAQPGYGKTVVMCKITSYYKVKTLIVVPTVTLSEQTVKELEYRLPNAKILSYGIGDKIEDNIDVVVVYAPRIGGNVEAFKKFQLVVLDEIHMLSSPTFLQGLLATTPKRILGLTATPGNRNAISEMFVGGKKFDSSHIKRWSISFPKVKAGFVKEYKGKDGYAEALGDIAKSSIYVTQIVRMIKFFLKCNERIIAITMRTELSDTLSAALKTEGVDSQILSSGSKTGRNCDVTIGTHKMIGTGFDFSNFVKDFDGKKVGVVFFLGSIKDKTLMLQICGRCFRGNISHAVFPVVTDIEVFRNHSDKLSSASNCFDGCIKKEGFGTFLEFIALCTSI